VSEKEEHDRRKCRGRQGGTGRKHEKGRSHLSGETCERPSEPATIQESGSEAYSIATNFPYIELPSGFNLHPGGRMAYGPRSGDVYSIWTPERDVEVMVREDAAGGHSLAAARDLRDGLDAVVVALGVLGVGA
jgi:hypothetical protein